MKIHMTCRVEVRDGIGRIVQRYDSVLCADAAKRDWPQTRDKDEVTCKRCLRRMS